MLDGGFVGDGAQRTFTLEVWVSYGSLDEDDDDSIIDEDAGQLEEAFRSRIEPQVPGLLAINNLGWIPDVDSEEGGIFGFFEFEILYYGHAAATETGVWPFGMIEGAFDKANGRFGHFRE